MPLEGYLYARVLLDAMRQCGHKLSRACLISALDQRRFDVAGYNLQFSPGNRKGSRYVELTVMDSEGHLRR